MIWAHEESWDAFGEGLKLATWICRTMIISKKVFFYEWKDPGKVCKQIRQDLKTNTLEVFLEYNVVEQTIWSHQSWTQRYDIPNKAPNQSALLITNETLKIANGITFEN